VKRRRLIAIISVCTLLAIGLLMVIGVAVVMRTDTARNFVQQLVASRITGSVYIGRISGNPLVGLTVDSIAVRDSSGEMVVSTGRVVFDYDIRDIIDSRIHLRHVTVEHPYVHLRDHGKGKWNYMMSKPSTSLPGAKKAARPFGSYFVLDSVRLVDASFLLTMPTGFDDTLKGRARDSVIAHDLKRADRKITVTPRTEKGFSRTYMWTRANGLISHARISDPDSVKFGNEIHIANLDVAEFDPPFLFRNVKGVVRRLSDSAWFDISHFDLPGSTGSGTGKLVWGSDLPMRYDVVVRGDSVSLKDINWIYATLPTTGGGSMVLHITNKRNLRVMDYHIDSMDVKSTRSHLIGEMTFGVGGGLPLQVRNVNLKANPVDFALIETLSGKPLPVPWAGQIYGDVRAPGGLVTDFDVTSFNAQWRDAHVPGAVSRFSGGGGLDIMSPALTAFRDFDVNVHSLDLRSIQYLFPAFPRLQGTIAGTATLDSVWTDVRFRNADITHRDGPGTPSHFTGSGRVTDGSPFITYDVDLNADPVSFDMLRRSFPGLKLRGLAYGPIKISGQSPDLQIAANLVSAAGRLRYAGNIDLDSLGGYGMRGVGEFAEVDLSRIGVRDSAPKTTLSGRYDVNVRGATLGTLTGNADIRLGQSVYNGVTLDSTSRATLIFNEGRVSTADTAVIQSPMGRITAVGALGLPGGRDDSIAVTLVVDSLGKLRPYFSVDGTPAKRDSLSGMVTVNGYARGRLDSLTLSGVINGNNLFIRGLEIDTIAAPFTLADVLRAPSGQVNARLAKVKLGGLKFDSMSARVGVIDSAHATFDLTGRATNGDSLRLGSTGAWSRLAGATTVRLDSFALGFGASLWQLENPATLYGDATTLRLDSLELRSNRGGHAGMAGAAPAKGAIDWRVHGAGIPLSDLNRVIGQTRTTVSGVGDFSARMTGTREAPLIDARTSLDSILLSGVGIGKLLATGRYADDRATASADIFQGSKRVLHAQADSLPLGIRWLSYDTLPGRVRASAVADSADFTLIQAWVPDISNVVGKMFGKVSVDGSWSQPNASGDVSVADGGMRIDTLGIALSKIFGHVSLQNDTIRVDTLSAASGGDANTASLSGRLTVKNWLPSWFDLSMSMKDFLAYDRPELATVYARTDSGPIRLWGTLADDSLRGVIQVDRGAIYLPDSKLVGRRFSTLLDTVAFRTGRTDTTLLQRITDSLKTDLRAHIGGTFRLSADYADVPLTGDLNIVPVASTDIASRSRDYISRLAPVGTIYADRGRYSLVLPFFSKDFDVQRGGTITFDRDAQWNGVLDISARYVLRKPGQPDIPIIVDVTNRLLTPSVKISSEASFPISESDLISYLVFGEPGFDIFGQTARTLGGEGLVSSLFTPIATSWASEQLKNTLLGRWFDQFRLSTASLDQSDQGTTARNVLYATRLSGGKSFRDNTIFAGVSYGFCGLNSQYRQSLQSGGQSYSAFDQLGLTLDYRRPSSLTSGSTWQAASEPSTVALLCSPAFTGSQGIAPTPRQFSLSYLRFWRW
jgi:translocation and assembly module TamB